MTIAHRKYSNEFKKKICMLICDKKVNRTDLCGKFNVPVKTVEKWITIYKKNPNYFDVSDGYYLYQRKKASRIYNGKPTSELIMLLKSKDNQIEYLESLVCSLQLELHAGKEYDH